MSNSNDLKNSMLRNSDPLPLAKSLRFVSVMLQLSIDEVELTELIGTFQAIWSM